MAFLSMDEKIRILAEAAKYDVSCSSSGGSRRNSPSGMGNSYAPGICHSWAADGRCISLLKILFSNECIYDCAYCINRRSNKEVERASFTVDELVSLTTNFYRRNYIEGLFLSSGVRFNPDYTMESLMLVVKKLRLEENFNGYIHLKLVPGADDRLLKEAGLYADRVSVNIELPSENSLKALAPQKSKISIFKPMAFVGSNIAEYQEAKKKKNQRKPALFVPAGQSTQLIVGASPETDAQVLKLSEGLYNKMSLKRVYYSAYVPVIKNDNRLPANISAPPLLREHRLYQADWLLRFYHFQADEILSDQEPFLDEEIDPKTAWALRNLNLFPIEVNKADFEMLLRVPGIGYRNALRIVQARKYHILDFEHLKKMRVVLKRAKFFLTAKGKMYEKILFNPYLIRTQLITKQKSKFKKHQDDVFSLF